MTDKTPSTKPVKGGAATSVKNKLLKQVGNGETPDEQQIARLPENMQQEVRDAMSTTAQTGQQEQTPHPVDNAAEQTETGEQVEEPQAKKSKKKDKKPAQEAEAKTKPEKSKRRTTAEVKSDLIERLQNGEQVTLKEIHKLEAKERGEVYDLMPSNRDLPEDQIPADEQGNNAHSCDCGFSDYDTAQRHAKWLFGEHALERVHYYIVKVNARSAHWTLMDAGTIAKNYKGLMIPRHISEAQPNHKKDLEECYQRVAEKKKAEGKSDDGEPKRRGVGIIDALEEELRNGGGSVDNLTAKLHKRFPDRPVKSMQTTVRCQTGTNPSASRFVKKGIKVKRHKEQGKKTIFWIDPNDDKLDGGPQSTSEKTASKSSKRRRRKAKA